MFAKKSTENVKVFCDWRRLVTGTTGAKVGTNEGKRTAEARKNIGKIFCES
jgi:hypothetical protein